MHEDSKPFSRRSKKDITKSETDKLELEVQCYIENHIDKISSRTFSSHCKYEHLLEKYIHKIDWYNLIYYNDRISKSFMDRHIDKIGNCEKEYLFFNSNLIEYYIEDNIYDINWGMIESNPFADSFFEKNIDFIEKYIQEMDWSYLSRLALPESFFEKHIDKICWWIIASNDSLSEAFFERHINRFIPYHILLNKCLSEEFFQRHIVNIRRLSFHEDGPSFSEEFIERNIRKVSLMNITCLESVSESFVDRHLDMLLNEGLFIRRSFTSVFNHRCRIKLSDSFFERHIDLIEDNSLSYPVSEDFISRRIEKMDWHAIWKNRNLSDSFIEKYIDRAYWFNISKNIIENDCSITEALLEKYIDKIDWSVDILSKIVTPSFVDKHLDKLRCILPIHFNLDYIVRNKIKNTKYYSFDSLWKSR